MREPTVSSVMTTNVISIGPETPFKEIVATLTGNGISAVPVIGPNSTLIGVVSEADVLPKQEFHGGADPVPHGVPRRRMRWFRSLAFCAAELMTTPVLTIGPGEPVTLAARRMAEKKVRRLFVVDDDELVGVVSRRDVLGMFLRADDEILADIRERVLRREFGLDPAAAVHVDVRDGVATVDGELARRSELDLITRLIQAVPGVVGVRSTLRYRTDDLELTGMWTGFSP